MPSRPPGWRPGRVSRLRSTSWSRASSARALATSCVDVWDTICINPAKTSLTKRTYEQEVCRGLDERMLGTSISSAWRFRRMPHSPYGRNLRAGDGRSCLIHRWTSSVPLALMGALGRRHGVVQTDATRHMLLRLCAFVAFGGLTLEAFPSSSTFIGRQSRYRANRAPG